MIFHLTGKVSLMKLSFLDLMERKVVDGCCIKKAFNREFNNLFPGKENKW